jgi:hypothetical protein
VDEAPRFRYHDGAVLLVVGGALALASLAGPWYLSSKVVVDGGEPLAVRTESWFLLWGEVSDRGPAGERAHRAGLGSLDPASWAGAFPAAFVLVAVSGHALVYAGARGLRDSRPGAAPGERFDFVVIFALVLALAAVALVMAAITLMEGAPLGRRPGAGSLTVEYWTPGPAIILCGLSVAAAFRGMRMMRSAVRENELRLRAGAAWASEEARRTAFPLPIPERLRDRPSPF